MKSLPLKLLSSTIGISAIGTATYFGGKELFRVQTIKEKLSSDGFKFIPSSSQAQWEAEFKSDEESIKKILGDEATSNSLKEWCESKFDNSSINNETDLSNVKRWCLIRTISNQLGRKGKKLLVGAHEEGIEAKWDATIAKSKNDRSKDREKLGLKGAWDQVKNDDKEKIKKWCAINSESDYLVEKEETYELVEAWCTEEGA